MQVEFNDHTLEVTGNWTGRWLFLAPEYQLHIDEECVDTVGGPQLNPKLEATIEDGDGTEHRVTAELMSLLGYRPRCKIRVNGDTVQRDRVQVDNFLNPFLVLVILISTAVMLYVGPDVVDRYLPFV